MDSSKILGLFLLVGFGMLILSLVYIFTPKEEK